MPTFSCRALVGAILATGLVVLAGCSSRSGQIPITGSVLVNGAPGSLTAVSFWSEDSSGAPGTSGRVMTDDSGKFSIGDKEKDTGLMPGTYKVTFSRFVDRNGKAVHGGGKKSESDSEVPSKESIPESYRDKSTTPASAKVARDSTTFTFEISTK